MWFISPFVPIFFRPTDDRYGVKSKYIQKFAPTDNILLEVICDNLDFPPVLKLNNVRTGFSTEIAWKSWIMNESRVLYYYTFSDLECDIYNIEIGGFKSEPFEIITDEKELGKSTLIKYTMRNNRMRLDGVFWIDGIQHTFEFRVPGGFKDDDRIFSVDNEQFVTPYGNIVEMYGMDSVQRVFTLGNEIGCPIWFAELLNRILCCTHIYFEGVQYARKDSSIPEKTQLIAGMKSYVFKQNLQEVKDDLSVTFGEEGGGSTGGGSEGGGAGAGVDILRLIDDERKPTDNNVFSAARSIYEIKFYCEYYGKEYEKRFLRKDKEDSTDYLTGFNAGITIGCDKKQLLDIIRTTDTDTKPSDTGVYSSLMSDRAFQELEDKYIRKDRADSTLYPVDFMGGLSINSKRIGDIIRYYDEKKPVSTDANIYSALQTDQRIEEEFEGLDDKYLRKDKEDTAHKHITFEEGVTVYQLAELMNLDVKNLATIAKAVVSILRSSKFVDGFSGEGYQIWQDIATGDWNMTLDRLTVRKVMTIYELVMQKIRSVGGMVVVSAANGKVKSVERIGNNYLFTFEDTNTFQADDLMRCQVFSPAGLKYYWVKVASVSGESVIVPVSEFSGAVPAAGDECVLMGNATNKRRQNLIIISATEDGQPRFDCLNGVKSKTFEGCLKVRVGNLDGIGDSRFPADMQPSGHGLYGNNCFLTGVFVLANGKDVLTMFSIMEGMIRSEISTIRGEVNAADNYLGNASFGADLSLWSGTNDIRLFSVNGRLLSFNNNFYSDKRNFADIVMHEGKRVLRIKNSSITQYNSDLARHPEFDSKTLTDETGNPVTVKTPRRFFISFSYMVTRPGTLSVFFEDEHIPGDPDLFEDYEPIHHVEELSTTKDFRKMEISGLWNGKGNFYLSFTGDIYLYSLALTDNPLAEMEERFNLRFEATEEKIQANLEEIRKNGARLEEYHSEFLLTARNLQLQFTEDLSSAETRITEAYKSYVTLTAEKLEAGFKSDLGNAEKRITEAYGSAIEASAKGLRLEFTADLTDMEKGITEAYKSHVKLTAENLKAEFTTDLTNLRTGLTEAYTAAIEVSARGLRTDFDTSIKDISGKLTSHTGSFHVTAEKIEGMVTATDNINNTIKTAGWITTTDGNRLWAAISTVNGINGELTRHEGSFHVTADKIEGIVSDVTNINGRLITHTGSFHVTAEKIQSMVTATDNISNTIKTAGWITTAEGNTWWASKNTETAAANAAQAAIDAANAAAGALSAAQNAASAATNAQGKADSAYDKAVSNATAITQTNSSISAIAARFDADGHLIEGAGWVTTEHGSTLWAAKNTVDDLGRRVTDAEAKIEVSITEDDANNLISQATIQADRINFTGKTIINGKFVVDMDGNLILNDIIANNGVFSGALNASVFRTPFRTIRYEDTLSDGAGNRVYYIYLDEGSNLDIGGLMTVPSHEEYVYLPVSSASYGARVILYNSRPAYTRLGSPAIVRNRMCEQFRNLPSNATQFRVDAGKMVHLTFVNETSEDGSRKSSYWYVEDPENCVDLVNAAYTKIYERFE